MPKYTVVELICFSLTQILKYMFVCEKETATCAASSKSIWVVRGSTLSHATGFREAFRSEGLFGTAAPATEHATWFEETRMQS